MSGANVQPVIPVNGKYLTIEDIEIHAITTDDVHKCPTRVISLENTRAGMVFPLKELRKIRDWAKKYDVFI